MSWVCQSKLDWALLLSSWCRRFHLTNPQSDFSDHQSSLQVIKYTLLTISFLSRVRPLSHLMIRFQPSGLWLMPSNCLPCPPRADSFQCGVSFRIEFATSSFQLHLSSSQYSEEATGWSLIDHQQRRGQMRLAFGRESQCQVSLVLISVLEYLALQLLSLLLTHSLVSTHPLPLELLSSFWVQHFALLSSLQYDPLVYLVRQCQK